MAQFPHLPLFTDAFIADTGHLNATETGAYLMLLMVAWRSPDCKLPDDDQKLARWARVDPRCWPRIKRAVMAFWSLEDGCWTQARLLRERFYCSKKAAAARANGARGGRPKSLKTNEPANPVGNPELTQTESSYPYTYTYKEEAPLNLNVEPNDNAPSFVDPDRSKEANSYAFEAGVIRLTERDLQKWKAAFKRLDLEAELLSLEDWAGRQPKGWYHPVQAALAKKNRERCDAMQPAYKPNGAARPVPHGLII